MNRLDLHTHSNLSPDGGLKLEDYRLLLSRQILDYIAITDHNRIDGAQAIQAVLGENIIIGEEISANGGEIIGLFLSKRVALGMPLHETVDAIHSQGGLVYVPHPFDFWRKSGGKFMLEQLDTKIDILEIYNGRQIFNGANNAAERWSIEHKLSGAASSDAHGLQGCGNTYSIISSTPTAATLVSLLSTAKYKKSKPSLYALAYPNMNRIRKLLR